MSHRPNIPIDTVHLLPLLDQQLLTLLRSLTPTDWQQQTIAKQWKVKDVAAHLLDGNIRSLSMLRDDFWGESFAGNDYQGLLDFLNRLNADWVKAMKRVSPAMLILLHETTGKTYCDFYASLDPFAKAGFAVNWAGEEESKNWMHIAREYTEKWLHQQQIRDAVNQPGQHLEREFFYPFIDTCLMALPHTFRNIQPAHAVTVQITITGHAGGSWYNRYANGQWQLSKEPSNNPAATVTMDPDTSWRLFSKSLRPADLLHKITLQGDLDLANTALEMVSFMA
jgi:uncharacterized protein (TIGR03083 family)